MISDVEAFRAAWQAAASIVPDEKPNAKIQLALDRLADGVVARVAHGSTVAVALEPFLKVVKTGGAVSDPGSLGAFAFRDGDRWLVDVRMGYASSLSAYGPKGRLTLPANLRWSFRQFGDFFRTGSLVAFDGTSLSDAGVRFTFRMAFLRRTAGGYVGAGDARGTWSVGNDDANRFVAQNGRITFLTLDSPRAFFVSSPERLLRRREVWTTTGTTARRLSNEPLDLDVRAADDWLVAHRGQSGIPRELGMAARFRREKGRVEIEFDDVSLRFDLALVGKKNVVRKMTLLPAKG